MTNGCFTKSIDRQRSTRFSESVALLQEVCFMLPWKTSMLTATFCQRYQYQYPWWQGQNCRHYQFCWSSRAPASLPTSWRPTWIQSFGRNQSSFDQRGSKATQYNSTNISVVAVIVMGPKMQSQLIAQLCHSLCLIARKPDFHGKKCRILEFDSNFETRKHFSILFSGFSMMKKLAWGRLRTSFLSPSASGCRAFLHQCCWWWWRSWRWWSCWPGLSGWEPCQGGALPFLHSTGWLTFEYYHDYQHSMRKGSKNLFTSVKGDPPPLYGRIP